MFFFFLKLCLTWYTSCKRYLLFRQLFLITNQIIVGGKPSLGFAAYLTVTEDSTIVLLTLRVYALYECSIRILRYLTGIGIILVILPCVRYFLLLQFCLAGLKSSHFCQWALLDEMNVSVQTTTNGCHVAIPNTTYVYLL